MVERLNIASSVPTRTVVFIGSFSLQVHDHSSSPSRRKFVHSLFWPWARLPLLSEVSGQHFSVPTNRDLEIANSSAIDKPGWPMNGSVYAVDDIGIVVLSSLSHESP